MFAPRLSTQSTPSYRMGKAPISLANTTLEGSPSGEYMVAVEFEKGDIVHYTGEEESTLENNQITVITSDPNGTLANFRYRSSEPGEHELKIRMARTDPFTRFEAYHTVGAYRGKVYGSNDRGTFTLDGETTKLHDRVGYKVSGPYLLGKEAIYDLITGDELHRIEASDIGATDGGAFLVVNGQAEYWSRCHSDTRKLGMEATHVCSRGREAYYLHQGRGQRFESIYGKPISQLVVSHDKHVKDFQATGMFSTNHAAYAFDLNKVFRSSGGDWQDLDAPFFPVSGTGDKDQVRFLSAENEVWKFDLKWENLGKSGVPVNRIAWAENLWYLSRQSSHVLMPTQSRELQETLMVRSIAEDEPCVSDWLMWVGPLVAVIVLVILLWYVRISTRDPRNRIYAATRK